MNASSLHFGKLYRRDRPGAGCKSRTARVLEAGLGLIWVDGSGFGVRPLVVFSTGVRL